MCARVGLGNEMDTRCPREREETNCLHYANAVQVQLTVAKNRCRYRGMLSRTSRGFLSSPLLFLSLSLSLFIRRGVTLVSRFGRFPSADLEWNGSEGLKIESLSSYSYFTPLKIFLFSFFHPSYPAWILLSSSFFSFFLFFLCKKPRSLASPLPGAQWFRGKVSFSKNRWLVT